MLLVSVSVSVFVAAVACGLLRAGCCVRASAATETTAAGANYRVGATNAYGRSSAAVQRLYRCDVAMLPEADEEECEEADMNTRMVVSKQASKQAGYRIVRTVRRTTDKEAAAEQRLTTTEHRGRPRNGKDRRRGGWWSTIYDMVV
jgi:hypothetical protein